MRGCTYKEIAERLGISISGVYRHREKMLLQNKDGDTDTCESMLELAAKHQAWLAAQQDGTPTTDSE